MYHSKKENNMQNNSQNSANSNSTFYEKAKGAHHTANAVWMWLKIIGVVTLVIIAGYALWKLYHSFNVEEVKTQSFTMNEWKAVEAQKVIIGEINGHVTGRYGYRKVVHTNFPLLGERHDTMAFWGPGGKYVDVNGSAQISIGYNLLTGDRLFSDGATGFIKETKDSVILTVITDYPVPQMVAKELRTVPDRSNSLISGEITDVEFYAWSDTVVAQEADKIIVSEAEFFRDAYAKAIMGILSQTTKVVAHGKNIRIDLVVNGMNYYPKDNVKKHLDKDIPVNQTIFY